MRTAPWSQVAVPVAPQSHEPIVSPAREERPIGVPVTRAMPSADDALYCYASATAAPVNWDVIRRHGRGRRSR